MGGTRAVALLALGSFAMGTDAYAMAGLLPGIGADLHVSVSRARRSSAPAAASSSRPRAARPAPTAS